MKFALAVVLFACACAKASPNARDGDIIFHTSLSNQSLAVQRATKSRYSHMGIVFFRGGKPYVFEASATVRYTPLREWIARGQGKHFVLKRLKDSDKALTSKALGAMRDAADALQGRPYDLTFEWSDSRIYCSELVWKIYKRGAAIEIGALQRIKEFDLTDPVVASKMRERYGDAVPMNEPVISPVAMFDSPLLQTVSEN